MVDAGRLQREIIDFLPEDGTPVLNRVMRVMLARKLETAVDEDAFFAARDTLLAKGAVGRLRGHDIATHCEEHGVGLIRMTDPQRAAEEGGCEVLVDPRRKPTLASVVDGFLESRLSGAQKEL